MFEPTLEDMRRDVASMLARLSSRVKNMPMADFLKECGGDVQALIAKDKRQTKFVWCRGPNGCRAALALGLPPT